jgi:copper chaperone CopZ
MIRKVVYSLTFAVLLACWIGCATTEQDTTLAVADGSEVRVYEVFGMDCPGCHGGVEKLVKKIQAVHDAKANWQKKELVVTVRPGSELDDKDVFDAVRRANFTPGKRLK